MTAVRTIRFHCALVMLGALLSAGMAPGAQASAGAEPPVPTTPPSTPGHLLSREMRTLDGDWRYLVDPMRVGHKKGNGLRYGIARDVTLEPGDRRLVEYEWSAAPRIDVGADWNSQVPELAWYEGTLWYRTRVDVTPRADRRYFLYFEGSNYRTQPFLNGQALGQHRGGFTPFAFEVTQGLRKGSNSVVVSVDNRHGADTVPGVDFDWQNYGGITRPVHLVEVPQTYVHDAWAWLDADGSTIRAEMLLDGPKRAGQQVRLRIAELGIDVRARTDAQGRARLAAPARGLQRWSPAQPRRYAVEFSAGEDRVRTQSGFRTIQTRGQDILLNGEPVFLKGISLHEEPLGAVGTRRMDEASIRRLLREAQDLGVNFVRLAHYPHNERTVAIAEELGLLVWSEIPIYWDIDFSNEAVLKAAKAMMVANIRRDRHRANLIVWSVANETPNQDDRNRFLRSLIDTVRAEDPTRLVSAAMDRTPEVDGVFNVNDPLGAQLDLLAVNQYEGWYGDRTPSEVAALRWQTPYDKPLIFSEFGADAPYGFRASEDVRWSEDYQKAIYRETLAMTRNIGFLRGLSPWILKDFRSPRRWHGHQQYWNRKGLIDPEGRRKQAFDTLRDHYRTLP